jgi:hypothetical protein
MDKVLRFFNVKKKQKQKAEDVSIKTDLAAGKVIMWDSKILYTILK